MTRTPALVVLLVGVSVLPAGVALAEDEGPLADAGLDQKAEVGETVLLDAKVFRSHRTCKQPQAPRGIRGREKRVHLCDRCPSDGR